MNTDKKSQKTHGQPARRPDRNIIIPLRIFEPVTSSRMRCIQLQAAQMITKKSTQNTLQKYS